MKSKIQGMICLSLAATFTVAAVASLFSLAQLITTNDERLFKADDDQRFRMIARACEPSGQLWRKPNTDNFACIYSNANGESVIREVPNSPYLDAYPSTALARK